MTHPPTRLVPSTELWKVDDALGESLHFLRMSGVFYSRATFSAPWGLALPAMPDCMMFHAVTAGECRLEVDGGAGLRLVAGDFVLVPHGEGHRLLSAPHVPSADLFSIPREQVSACYERIDYGQGGAVTRMICGAVRFEHPAAGHLAKLLPHRILLAARDDTADAWLRSTLGLMDLEARDLRPGGETVITRLADILVIQAIRSWLSDEGAGAVGWLGALHDRQIGPAVLLMQRRPEHDWTVTELAAQVAMSRSAFSARFTELVGESPMAFLTRWRMQLALSWLETGEARPADLPSRLGYGSQAAFSRAFKRIHGKPPGWIRGAGLGPLS